MGTVLKSLSLLRFFKATSYAIAGIYYAFQNEPSFLRIAILEIILAIIAWWQLRDLSIVKISILVMAGALVLITEIINTSIEILVDMVQPDTDDRVKRIKDCAAGATCIATCSGLLVSSLVMFFH